MSEPRAASGPRTLDALDIAGDMPVCRAASGLPTPSLLFLELAGQRQEACGGRKKGPSATRLSLAAAGTREDQSPSGETCVKPGASFVPALRGASLVPALPKAPQLLGTRSGVRSCPRRTHQAGRASASRTRRWGEGPREEHLSAKSRLGAQRVRAVEAQARRRSLWGARKGW